MLALLRYVIIKDRESYFMRLTLLALLIFFSSVSTASADYCTIKQEKFPCKVFLFIYAPDGKEVKLVIQINQDGSQVIVYDNGKSQEGLKEAHK